MEDSKLRFSDRVHDYKKYRPTYPLEAIQFVKDHCKIGYEWKIADIGSGTGISTEALLKVFECSVYAVEPNSAMRSEAENKLGFNPLFHSIDGSSESTTLPNESINLITAFQAFHWFDKEKAKTEFQRILKEPQWVLLVWNDRKTTGTPFLEGYDRILRDLPDYQKSSHKSTDKITIQNFIENDELKTAEFPNAQRFDFDGLKGRFFSSSYTPKYGTDEYKRQIAKLEILFEKTNKNGRVDFLYNTQVFIGQIK